MGASKTFPFAGSDKGAERLAHAYTLTGSCHMNGVNPLAYLDRLDELLPAELPARRPWNLLE